MIFTFLTEKEGVAQLTPMLNLPRLPLKVNVHENGGVGGEHEEKQVFKVIGSRFYTERHSNLFKYCYCIKVENVYSH